MALRKNTRKASHAEHKSTGYPPHRKEQSILKGYDLACCLQDASTHALQHVSAGKTAQTMTKASLLNVLVEMQ
jgi:hypothetical protein